MNVYAAIRPLIFSLSPERAHHLAKPLLRSERLCRALGGPQTADPRLEVRIGDARVASPVGLAPGFDKYGELTAGMSRLGFGYLVPGTIMSEPRQDTPPPRLVRLPEERALINCVGLPGKGVDYSAYSLAAAGSSVPLIISIGSSTIEGFRRAHARLEPYAAAIELNLQCHHDETGPFEDPASFEALIGELVAHKTKPLFVKVNAYHGADERTARMKMVARGAELGVDGYSAVGTFLTRADDRLSLGRGIVSGEPLKQLTLKAIEEIREATEGRVMIRARGGIASGLDAFRAIAAGADTVEVFTGFIYEGWRIPARINSELLALLDREGVDSVAALRGRAPELAAV